MCLSSESFLDALLNLPIVKGATLSPDGSKVAFTWVGMGEARDVFVAGSKGEGVQRITETPNDTYVLRWTADSTSLLMEEDHDGDERSRIFLAPADGSGPIRRLNEASPNYFLRGCGMDPEGSFLIYGGNLDPDTGEEIEATYILRQDLKTGERRAIARPEKPGDVIPRLSPKGDWVLYPRQDLDPSGQQIWLVRADGQDDHLIINEGASAKVEARWIPSGEEIAFLSEAGSYRRVGVYSLKTKETRWVIDDPSRNFTSLWFPKNADEMVLWEVIKGRGHSVLVNPHTGAERIVDSEEGNIELMGPIKDGAGRWLARFYGARQPSEFVSLDPDAPDLDISKGLLGVWSRTKLRRESLARAESITWESIDGLEIQGWLYRAKGEARGTIVYVHGGPTAMSEDALSPEIQYYVSQGFNVLDPNYRGSVGFGLSFMESIKEDGWGGREQEDIRFGIKHLMKLGVAKPNKVAMTGTSYGGYSSWHGVTHFSREELAASVPICGMTDLVVDYETTRPDLRPYSEEMMGGSPATCLEKYQKASPIHFVKNIEGALLIVQGAKDPNVTMDNVRVVTETLDEAKIPYETLIFEDEGHGIARTTNQKHLYGRIVEFVTRAFEAVSRD